jgi:hypothetical protein
LAVRRESVLLQLEDDFTSKMLAAATATKALEGSLRDLDGTSVDTSRSMSRTTTDSDRLSSSAVRGSAAIDKYSGRMGILLKVAGALGPALIPIGAVGIAGVAGLASQLGFAAIGMGSLIIAAQGVGDALKAVNKASLDPTVENLEAAQKAMKALGPDAQDFVARFQQLRPVLAEMRDSAASGWFPGLTEALDSLEVAAPKIERILRAVSEVGGDLVADAAASLAGPEWADFMNFIAREAPPALEQLGHTVGHLTEGMAQLWMAFSPVNDDFGDWLLGISRSFDDWATGLSQTQGFEDFVAYLHTNGPKVADAVGAIANALVQIVEAAAPLGGPVLDTITDLANVIARIADSPLGAPIMVAVTAFSALSLVTTASAAGLARVNAGLVAIGAQGPKTAAALNLIHRSLVALAALEIGSNFIDSMRDKAKGAAPAVDDLARSLQDVNSAALTDELGGSLQELLDATDNSGLEGLAIDAGNLADQAGIAGDAVKAFVPGLTNAADQADKATDAANSLDEALVALVASAGPDQAQRAFLDMAKAQHLSGQQTVDLLKLLPKYKGALQDAGFTADEAGDATGRLARESRRAAREQLQAARSAERVKAAMKEQRAAVAAMADQWTNYSQKVKLAGTDIDTLMRRWERLGEASANMAENIRTALEHGLDPKVIKDVIDTLGPQGAATALQQFADAGGRARKRIEASFQAMSDGARDFAGAYDELTSAVNGTPLTMGDHGRKVRADLDSMAARADHTRERLEALDRTPVHPTADIDLGPLQAGVDRAHGLLVNLDGDHADTYIITHLRTVRDPGDTAGGPPALGPGSADGGTVPGRRQPYGDSLLMPVAPTEEIISNRYGQADRFRSELKRMNAWRPGMSTRASERPMSAAGARGGTMRHVIEVKVVGGEFDLTKARAQIGAVAREVSRDEIDQDSTWRKTQED